MVQAAVQAPDQRAVVLAESALAILEPMLKRAAGAQLLALQPIVDRYRETLAAAALAA